MHGATKNAVLYPFPFLSADGVPNLFMVETVDSEKVHTGRALLRKTVLGVQVHTGITTLLLGRPSQCEWQTSQSVSHCKTGSLFSIITCNDVMRLRPCSNASSVHGCLQIATLLDKAVGTLGREPLQVMVQVNTSGEECKLPILHDRIHTWTNTRPHKQLPCVSSCHV